MVVTAMKGLFMWEPKVLAVVWEVTRYYLSPGSSFRAHSGVIEYFFGNHAMVVDAFQWMHGNDSIEPWLNKVVSFLYRTSRNK